MKMNIFREVVKRISPHMKAKGFLLSGKNYCYISNDIAYCLGFDTPSGLLYVTAYVMPLYVPCENRYYTYGNRLNIMQEIALPTLRKDSESGVIDRWCRLLCQYIDDNIIPFYEQINTPNKLVTYVEQAPHLRRERFACPQVYIERLRLFTYLYLHELSKVIAAMGCYRNALEDSAFLADHVRSKYMNEVESVEFLIRDNSGSINDYCNRIINNTRKTIE